MGIDVGSCLDDPYVLSHRMRLGLFGTEMDAGFTRASIASSLESQPDKNTTQPTSRGLDLGDRNWPPLTTKE